MNTKKLNSYLSELEDMEHYLIQIEEHFDFDAEGRTHWEDSLTDVQNAMISFGDLIHHLDSEN